MKKLCAILIILLGLSNTVPAQISTFPHTEGFEGSFTYGDGVDFLTDWWGSKVQADTLWQDNSFPYSGSSALAAIPFGEEEFLYAQVNLDLTGLSNVYTTFYAASRSTGGAKSVRLFLTLSIDGGTTWTPMVEIGSHDTFPNEDTPYQQYTYAFNPIAYGQSDVIMRFAIRPGIMQEPAAKLLIDEVVIQSSATDIFKPVALEPDLLGQDSLSIIFSEPVAEATAETVSNYVFSPAATVSSATLSATQDTVYLKLSAPLEPGVTYALTVSSIEDLAGNVMTDAEFEVTYSNIYSGLIITEIFYDSPPVEMNDPLEFIELYNATCQPMNIGGVQLKEAIFSGPLPNYTLEPGKYYVMTKNTNEFLATFGVAANTKWTASNLENTSDLLLLLPADHHAGFSLDSVVYQNVAPWPTEGAGLGYSIELKNAFLDNTLGENWQAPTDQTGTFEGAPIYATPFKKPSGTENPVVDLGEGGNLCGLTEITLDAGNPGSVYLWSTGETTQTITATANGTYSVVVNNGVGAASDEITIAFVPAITATGTIPAEACQSTEVAFTDTSVDATSWLWSFGDGTTSTLQNPAHIFAANGTHTVTLIARNTYGCSDTLTSDINILTNVVDFTVPAVICENVEFSFTDNSASAVTWAWDFGDGTTSTLQNPAHTYAADGTYTVSLTVANSLGCSKTVSKEVVVNPNEVNWTLPALLCEGAEVAFADNSTSAASWAWNFGDGNTSNLQNPSHVYASEGPYNVSLTVTTSAGCTTSKTAEVIVVNYEVGWTLPTLLCEGTQASFADNTASAVSWAWNFGDGGTSNLQSPVYAYSEGGTYNVTLTVGNAMGCSRVLSETVEVNNNDVQWAVAESPTCTYTSVDFADNTASATGWVWSFGDGNGSTEQNPTHIYTEPGEYTVSLAVTNALGCTSSVSQMLTVSICMGVEDFAAEEQLVLYPNPTEGVIYLRINWNDADQAQLRVLNAAGQTVMMETLTRKGGNIQSFNAGGLSNGLYLIRLQVGHTNLTRKLFIEK